MSVTSVGTIFDNQTQAKAGQSPKSAADLAAEFAEALKASGLQVSGTSGMSAADALRTAFERAAQPVMDKMRPADDRQEQPEQAERSDASQDKKADQASDAKAEDKNTAPAVVEAAVLPGQTVEAAAPQVAEEAPAAPTQEVAAEVPAELIAQGVQTVGQDATLAQTSAPVLGAEQAQVAAPAQGALAADQAAAPTDLAPKAPIAEDMVKAAPAAKPDAVAEVAPQVAATGAANLQNAAKPASDLAQAQGQEMALELDDTGAQIQIRVDANTGSNAPKAGAQPQANLAQAADPQAQANLGDGQQQSLAQGQQKQTLAQQTEALQAGKAAQTIDPKANFNVAAVAPFVAEAPMQTTVQGSAPANPANAPVVGVAATGANGLRAPHTAQTAQHVPQTARTMPTAQQVVDQISVQIRSAQAGDTIKINLKPAELGAIEVKIQLGADGKVSAMVTADNKDTLALLQKDARALELALKDAGLDVDNKNLSFQLRDGSSQTAQDQAPKRRSRLAAARAADAANAEAAIQAQARYNTGRGGVDIKV